MNVVIVRRIRLIILSVLSAFAGGELVCHACDWATIGMWSRTWHAPNALETPLREYYIPRQQGRCDRAENTNWVTTAADGSVTYAPPAAMAYGLGDGPATWSYPPGAAMGLEPRGLHRLGQLPNELEIDAGIPATGPNP